MNLVVDLNSDLGEGAGHDHEILDLVRSAAQPTQRMKNVGDLLLVRLQDRIFPDHVRGRGRKQEQMTAHRG